MKNNLLSAPLPTRFLTLTAAPDGLGSLRLVTLFRTRERVVARELATGRGC